MNRDIALFVLWYGLLTAFSVGILYSSNNFDSIVRAIFTGVVAGAVIDTYQTIILR